MLLLAVVLAHAPGCAGGGAARRPPSPPIATRTSPAPAPPPPRTPAAITAPARPEPPPPREPEPVTPELATYREAIASVLSPASRSRLPALADPAIAEGPCHADAFSSVLTDAVARQLAAPAFQRLGAPYLEYARLARGALPFKAHADESWANFTLASPATERCESEDVERPSAFCARARLADEIGLAVATAFSPEGVAAGEVPVGNGEVEAWSVSLEDVLDAAAQLGVPRAAAERALIDAFGVMLVKARQSCELLARQVDGTLVPVVLHVATNAGAPVMSDAVLRDWLEVADAHFGDAGIVLAPEVRALPEGFAELRRIPDRHALKRFLVARRVNVFVVGRMLDPVASETTRRAAAWQGFEPSGRLAGAHIEAEGREPRTYVIVSAEHGSALSLTHELGHFFGVAHHKDPTNIMSYGAERQHFDDTQLETFQRTLRGLVRRRVLDFP